MADDYLDLTNLVTLNLSHNCMELVELEEPEKYLPELRHLNLSKYKLMKILTLC